jgi:predicted nucleic acid-binding protein
VILADTSIWIDHLRSGDALLTVLLDRDEVAMHPYIIGEVVLGHLRQRDLLVRRLNRLPKVSVARHHEVLRLIDSERLFGLGLGYVDVHLLAAARLASDIYLWTRDKRLAAAAEQLSLGARLTH